MALDGDRHGRRGAHAVGAGGGCGERHEQGLRRTGRQGDAGGQRLAVAALDAYFQGDVPVHGVLQAQAHGAGPGPVPHLARRAQAQTGMLGGIEGEAAQHLAFGGGLGGQLRKTGGLAFYLHGVGGLDETEQGLLPLLRGEGRRGDAQGENEGQ